jgi:hypothetical protein
MIILGKPSWGCEELGIALGGCSDELEVVCLCAGADVVTGRISNVVRVRKNLVVWPRAEHAVTGREISMACTHTDRVNVNRVRERGVAVRS